MRLSLGLGTVVACILAAPSFGALVAFQGMNAGSVGNEVTVTAGEDAVFSITVSVESLTEFDAADLVIGSDDVTDLTFSYSDAWMAAMSSVAPVSYDNSLYLQDALLSSNNSTPVGASLLVGTLTVDTTGLADGDYIVKVDPSVDGFSALWLSGVDDPLAGSGMVHVVPEPFSLALLSMAVIAGYLRRR